MPEKWRKPRHHNPPPHVLDSSEGEEPEGTPMFSLRQPNRIAALMAGLMLLAAITVSWLKVPLSAPSAPNVELERLVPVKFGDWTLLDEGGRLIVNPQAQETLQRIYSQTLSRTYVDSSGVRIMLSLAYGSDQRHDSQVHKPEVCYPAQGFQIRGRFNGFVKVASDLLIPVMRMDTVLGRRNEPVTYWIRVGDKVVRGAIEQNLARVRYGLQRKVPDGLLFRVSEINPDSARAYLNQDRFIDQFLSALGNESRSFFIGELGSSDPRDPRA